MTPTTSNTNFVAAGCNAGFIVELACGGLPRMTDFESAVKELTRKIHPGRSIWLNILYLNTKQWKFQFPAALSLRRQGYPIEAITIAAGVPTLNTADDVMSQLESAGILIVGFKPGTIDAINRVIQIAKRHPRMTIVLQWTGGRAGGHHSYEDLFQPLLQSYAAIRANDNIILVVGSGIGDAHGMAEFISGHWSMARGFSRMPVDAVLVASRVMAAKEAQTAQAVKQMLVKTEGLLEVDQHKWEDSYDGVAGGIISIKSEFGEQIHVVANRCACLWRHFDNTLFCLPPDVLHQTLQMKSEEIVERLNSDYQKIYFPQQSEPCVRTPQGITVPKLIDMTYSHVLRRMIDLMCTKSPDGDILSNLETGAWLHKTFYTRFLDFLQRTQQRFGIEKDQSQYNYFYIIIKMIILIRVI